MKPSSAAKKNSRVSARNATLLNLLGTPGLGSLMAGRMVAGLGQLVIFLVGFALFCGWALVSTAHYYQMAFSDAAPTPNTWGNKAVFGVALCVVAWVWSLITSISLQRAASTVRLESLESFTSGQLKLDEAHVILALMALPEWRQNVSVIARTFTFKDFATAVKFVNIVADLALQAQHHPDFDIRGNKVTLALTTHDVGGLTEKDFALARQCDSLAKAEG
jgi:4a-hydroxytetrahydrobiopterin dehydratase